MIDTNELVNENMNLIYKIATKFYGVDKEDLVQAGIIGLLKAWERYDKEKGAKFSSYAYTDIYGEMYLLASKKSMKVDKNTLKLYKIIEKTRYDFAQKLGKIPSNIEISKILNLNIEMVDYACMSAVAFLSIDEKSDEQRAMHEVVFEEEKISLDDKLMLQESLSKLTIDEKNVIQERYYNDKTQSDAAKKLKMSQVMVSRLEKKGIEKMRRYISV